LEERPSETARVLDEGGNDLCADNRGTFSSVLSLSISSSVLLSSHAAWTRHDGKLGRGNVSHVRSVDRVSPKRSVVLGLPTTIFALNYENKEKIRGSLGCYRHPVYKMRLLILFVG
jgi:hypothetical protein